MRRMRNMVEILKLCRTKVSSDRELAARIDCSLSTVRNYMASNNALSAQDIPRDRALLISFEFKISQYNVLISYHNTYYWKDKDKYPIIGQGYYIAKEFLSDEELFKELEANYFITGTYRLQEILDEKKTEFMDVFTSTRINEIATSRYIECAPIKINEVILICQRLNMRFGEIWAVVPYDIFNDTRSVDVAHTLQNYIQLQDEIQTNFKDFDVEITEPEKKYLQEQLRVYRKLVDKGE
ncbi:hypothetical protein D3C74_137750 [compost metagenome]